MTLTLLRRTLLITILIFAVILLVFTYNNWTMWQYKNGSKPVQLNLLNTVEQVPPQGDMYLLKNYTKAISSLKIGLTDFYFVEGANSLTFGIWYKKWDYNGTDRLFNISMIDSDGKIYEAYIYSIFPSVGVYETFQVRQIRGVDINNIESLSLRLYLEDQSNDDVVSFNIFNRNQSKLELVK